MARCLLLVFIVATFIDADLVEAKSRQRRCIVIQKQSGTSGDSSEADGDEEYRKPQPKEPSDRLRSPAHRDTENISPELLKYKLLPTKMRTRENRLRNRFLKKYAL